MSNPSYGILDEPRPSRWSKLISNPILPFFAFMFSGSLTAWIWFAVNSFLLGSPTKSKEVAAAFCGLLGGCAITFTILFLFSQGMVSEFWLKYLFLSLILWKLAVSYYIFVLQQRSFEIYRYFHEDAGLGTFILIAIIFLDAKLGWAAYLPDFWRLVLS